MGRSSAGASHSISRKRPGDGVSFLDSQAASAGGKCTMLARLFSLRRSDNLSRQPSPSKKTQRQEPASQSDRSLWDQEERRQWRGPTIAVQVADAEMTVEPVAGWVVARFPDGLCL